MERLTIDEIIAHCERHTKRNEITMSREYFETEDMSSWVMKEYWEHRQVAEWLKELQALKDKQEQGLLIETKCTIGSIVYALWSVPIERKYVIYPAEVKEISFGKFNQRGMAMYKLEPISFRGRYNKYYDDDFGKLVFYTEAEAEEALAKMGGK